MSTALQLRRGTTAQHSSFTGLAGEVTVDTTKKTAVVHDGTTSGGIPLLRQDINNLPNASIGVSKLNASGTPSTTTYLRGDGAWIKPTTAIQDIVATGAPDATTFLRGDGTWAAPQTSAFTSGTLMLFQQTAAPTGWTKQTTHDNKALRVVSGTASSGGTTAFTTVFANQTPTITTSGLSVGATTLTTAQMPSHTHNSYAYGYVNQNYGQGGEGSSGILRFIASPATTAAGSGGSHTHSIAGSATSSAITLNVAYVDLIIASKN